MSAIDDVTMVSSFNGAINAENLDRLGELMTETHRFVDSTGATIDGRVACVDAWRGLFAAFPDYRNVLVGAAVRATGWCSSASVRCAVSLNLMGRPSGASSFEKGSSTSGESVNRLSNCLRPRLTSVEQFVSRRGGVRRAFQRRPVGRRCDHWIHCELHTHPEAPLRWP
jgi:SnoaL-like domain